MEPNATPQALHPAGLVPPTTRVPEGPLAPAPTTPAPPAAVPRLVLGGGDRKRIDLPCETLGFLAPPCTLHLRFVRTGPEWMLVAQAPPGRPTDVAKWLAPYRPALTRVEPGLAPKSLRAIFEELPAAWSRLLSTLSVTHIDLRPEGAASVFVDGGDVDRFVDGLEELDGVRVRGAEVGQPHDVLTPRQREAMSLAVALGYYEVPHRIDMRGLAKRMGLSLGAVSELLRRGQSVIVHSFFDSLSAERWRGVE